MDHGNKLVTDLSVVELLFVIVFGWILVALWQRTVDNFTFNSLGLNKDSTYHTFIIAVVCTSVFLFFSFLFNDITGGINADKTLNPVNPLGPVVPTSSTTHLQNTVNVVRTKTQNFSSQFNPQKFIPSVKNDSHDDISDSKIYSQLSPEILDEWKYNSYMGKRSLHHSKNFHKQYQNMGQLSNSSQDFSSVLSSQNYHEIGKNFRSNSLKSKDLKFTTSQFKNSHESSYDSDYLSDDDSSITSLSSHFIIR